MKIRIIFEQKMLLMKKIVFFFVSFILLYSCETIRPLGKEPYLNPQPFVQLKDGTKKEATKVDESFRFVIADNKEYKKKEVAFYCDGRNTYGNIYRRTFARKIYEGDLSIYRRLETYTSTSSSMGGGMHTSSHTRVYDYIQKEGTNALLPLNYKNLKLNIQPNELGFDYLKKYKKTRIVGRAGFYEGIAMFVLGTKVMMDGANNNNDNAMNTGAAMFAVGFTSLITFPIILAVNHYKLYRAVKKHNGIVDGR